MLRQLTLHRNAATIPATQPERVQRGAPNEYKSDRATCGNTVAAAIDPDHEQWCVYDNGCRFVNQWRA